MNTRADVALILWNTDVIQLVSLVLLDRNLKSCGIEPLEGPERIEDLIVSCSPSVVVFDLAPPYGRSAAVALRLLDRFPDRSFVMTCADPALALRSAPWLSGYPMFQKPYEIDEIANTVRSMMTRAARRRRALHKTVAANNGRRPQLRKGPPSLCGEIVSDSQSAQSVLQLQDLIPVQ